VAAGDLQTTVESSSDEIGRLAGSFNQMVEKIRDTLQEARSKKQKAQETASAAGQIIASSDQMAKASAPRRIWWPKSAGLVRSQRMLFQHGSGVSVPFLHDLINAIPVK
jgi:hypothetical protein